MIQITALGKRYSSQDKPALRDVHLEIQDGEFIALMGPSGCGKTTLLNIIGTMDTPTDGTVIINGTNPHLLNDEDATALRRTQMGFIFQFFNLLPTLTVRENIALPLILALSAEAATLRPPARNKQELAEQEEWVAKKVDILLEKTHMQYRAHYYPAQLSGGEMQRVAIARALIHEPSVILADEPTGNLDTETGLEILSFLQSLAQSGDDSSVKKPDPADYRPHPATPPR